MNKISRYIYIFLILILVLSVACKKDKTYPSTNTLYGNLVLIHGDNQTGTFSEVLSDSIRVIASTNSSNKNYLIKHLISFGNGTIAESSPSSQLDNFYIDSTGILDFKWKLGCNFTIQKIQLLLYLDSSSNGNGSYNYYSTPSDSLTITANAIKPNGYGKACGCRDVSSYYSKIISHDNTLFLVNGGLYNSTDGGLNWEKVDGLPDIGGIIDAQFNSSGWLYVLSQYQGVCYSKDMISWEFINNGILDYRDPTAFLVEDNTLFVSFYFDGPYRTSDNGGFWGKLLLDNQGGNRYFEINRHPSGDLYLFDKWDYLWISTDNGDLWGKVDIANQYVNPPLYDLEIDEEGRIYIGADDATISIVSPPTYTGEVHSFYELNHNSQDVDDVSIINNIAYFTVNGNPTPGLYSSQGWGRLDLGFEGNIINYYLKEDGTFLLLAYDGLYYYYD